MKLQDQFKILTTFFENESIDYALIGAFALHAYGYTRATKDIDFLVQEKHQNKIVSYLEKIGFQTLHCSEGFSNHFHSFGKTRIDLVYVDEQTANILFSAASPKLIMGDLSLKTVSPKHLVTMKLFAVKNDSSRKFKEFADIREMLKQKAIDNLTLKEVLKSQNMEKYYEEITGFQN
ncbi:MAG: nucleotidyltransferase family protein [Deferribacteres bacterium]|nr:nucleotidyltransferase family protein [candidate division KSB1 bacterium]MCB9503713.1 nucleotidyltransferase family protein [Deferribacteres bacterium]